MSWHIGLFKLLQKLTKFCLILSYSIADLCWGTIITEKFNREQNLEKDFFD